MSNSENSEDPTIHRESGASSSPEENVSSAHDVTSGLVPNGKGLSSGGRGGTGLSSQSGSSGGFELHQPSGNAAVAPRFVIEKEHAKGGLGEVFIARDHQLDRKVALKKIRTSYADDVGARQRFELEACVTGGLEHPGIVPVYSFGRGDNGRPFYAMRFISGETLKEAIINLHHEYESAPRRLYDCATFRNLLDGFVDSCQAIGYAHSRGIVHRDIKPSNIMLGEFGETLVVDWGLAKCVGREQHFEDFDASTLMIQSGSHAETSFGSTIGTPPFMSPEQANGDVDEIGPRSDIYSLGATLYMLLTGLPPFKGKNASDIVDSVKQGQFIPAHERNKDIPRALSEISLKAMSLAPSNRYMTAIDIAVDVKAWMADKATQAYRDPWTTRVRRWLKEHQVFAVASAVGLMTVLTASILASFFLNAEKNRTAEALASLEIEQQKTVAALDAESTALQQSQALLDSVSSDLVGDLLSQQDELSKTDAKFLNQLRGRFEEFVSINPDKVQESYLANGHLRISRISQRLGDYDAAGQSAMTATEIFRNLEQKNSADPEIRGQLAKAISQLALTEGKTGNEKQAVESWREAEREWTRLANEFPSRVEFRTGLADVSINKANALYRTGESTNAQLAYAAANQIYETIDQSELDTTQRVAMNQGLANMAGILAEKQETWQQSVDIYGQCTQTGVEILEKSPSAKNRRLLSNYELNAGNVLVSMKRHSRALPMFVSAAKRQAELVDEFPLRAEYRFELGRAQLGVGESLDALGKSGALKNMIAAQTTFRKLMDKLPESKSLLARTLESLAKHYLSTDTASVNAKKNHALGQKLLVESKEIRRHQAEADKDNAALQKRLLFAEINWASYMRRSGELEEALLLYRPILEELDRRDTKIQDVLLRKALFGIGDILDKQKKYDESLKCWSRLCADFSHPHWNVLELQRGIALVRTGKISEGVNVAQSLLMNADVTPVMHYDAGCCCAVAAELLAENSRSETGKGDKSKSSTAAAGRDADWYRKRAMKHLTDAADDGFLADEKMRVYVASDHDLDSLRSLETFKEFCEKHSVDLP